MAADPFAQLKMVQREAWAMFAPQAIFTVPPAALLVQFAGIRAEMESLIDKYLSRNQIKQSFLLTRALKKN